MAQKSFCDFPFPPAALGDWDGYPFSWVSIGSGNGVEPSGVFHHCPVSGTKAVTWATCMIEQIPRVEMAETSELSGKIMNRHVLKMELHKAISLWTYMVEVGWNRFELESLGPLWYNEKARGGGKFLLIGEYCQELSCAMHSIYVGNKSCGKRNWLHEEIKIRWVMNQDLFSSVRMPALSFNVPSEDQGSHPDDLSVSV